MDWKPTELTANGYQLLAKLEHRELVPFIQRNLKKRTFFANFYLGANLLAVGLIGWQLYLAHEHPDFGFGSVLGYLGYGVIFSFCLVPLHEFLHVLAYRYAGARNTSYAVDWKKFIFMALADRFVASEREFRIVALTPFTVITICLLLLLPFAGGFWQFTISGMLLAHTAFCSGDFGLLSYFQTQKSTFEVVTYDITEEQTSYFYGRPKSRIR